MQDSGKYEVYTVLLTHIGVCVNINNNPLLVLLQEDLSVGFRKDSSQITIISSASELEDDPGTEKTTLLNGNTAKKRKSKEARYGAAGTRRNQFKTGPSTRLKKTVAIQVIHTDLCI